MTKFEEMRQAVFEARLTIRAADQLAGEMASMLIGRTKTLPIWVLKDLKRELRDFSIHTGKWKGEK